ncbi:MAG: MFS transporter [Bacteroidia bacterium]|nr:MFS transporter [Bacteroidia bacterium]MDW8157449.1 MFS transporter [Bacteroidia bacterium]
MKVSLHKGVSTAITVSALGYFVDIYDLVLFGVVRIDSLKGIGVPAANITREGEFLLNIQMIGLLIGGIIWGILGDKKGRLSVLFGSILLYSLANLANAFINDLVSYAILRFIAGVGLAGELGAGVTLVSELMSIKTRGWGATIIASFGALGAVVAGAVATIDWQLEFANWRMAYLIGGIMGLALLMLRIGVYESGMFQEMKESKVKKGNFLQLFYNKSSFVRYLRCILIGVPIWFVIGILIFQSKEFSESLGLPPIVPAFTIMAAYAGLTAGDLLSGIISQSLGSRKKAVLAFLIFSAILIVYYLNLPGATPTQFYILCFLMGCGTGYWAMFMMIAAEQFGTNIRATVTTTVPNFVRGSVVPVTWLFQLFRDGVFAGIKGANIPAAAIVGIVVMSLAFWALYKMEETFGKDLNYLEIH